jgi:hypothetical protein
MVFLGGWLIQAHRMEILGAQARKIAGYSGIVHIVRGTEAHVHAFVGESEVPIVDTATHELRTGITRLGLETIFSRLPSGLGVHHLPLVALGVILLLQRRSPSDVFVVIWPAVLAILLLLTLPDHRYFLSAFPAAALLMARGLRNLQMRADRVIVLSLLLLCGHLYLYVDWARESHLFLQAY